MWPVAAVVNTKALRVLQVEHPALITGTKKLNLLEFYL